jgi:predicted Zn finger-like uncharacterized protein
MKFTCESCSAQYMISDEKVGATGVKVRCKKCGNVITVRRAADGGDAAAPPAPSAPPASGDGLDAELGSAFDSAFGDRPPPADLDATQAMEAEDAKRISDGPAPLSSEWYVAIGEAQVGPLPIADVKRKWEQGDIGPDSLCWRPGMGDWSPLSTVNELASVLSPIPRPASRAAAAPKSGTPAFGTPAAPAPAAPVAPASTAAPDATWKPAGASALAALASEELQARAAPAGEPAKPAAKPAGVKSLVEQMNLAEGGIEPTGALPLSIKGVERTDEKPIRRQSSVARGQEEIRQKRGMAKVVVGVVVAVVAIVAAGAFGVIKYLDTKLPANAVATAEARPAPPAPPPVAPPVQPPAQAAPPATPPPAQPAAAEPPPPAPPPVAVAAAEPPAPPPAPPPAKGAKAAPVKVARATPPPAAARAAREPDPEPAPPPKPAPKKKGDGLLDGIDGGGDDALADALGGGSSGRSVYVPPKPGGSAAAMPDTVSDGQVTEGIKGKFESLAECAEKGSGSGATIVMQWDISAEGGARGVKCKAPCGDPPVGNCLASVIKSIRFPRSVSGRTRVEFPFKF